MAAHRAGGGVTESVGGGGGFVPRVSHKGGLSVRGAQKHDGFGK